MARAKQKSVPQWLANLDRFRQNSQQFGWLVMLFIVGLLAISAINKREGAFLEEITIELAPLPDSTYLLNDADLMAELENAFTKPLDGLQLEDINLEWVETILERHPFIREADAFVDGNTGLFIRAEQRQPMLRIIAENGQNYFLDETGSRMPLSEQFTPRILVASGNIAAWNNQFMEDETHQLYQLFELAQYLREDVFLDALIEQLYLNNKGEIILAPKVGDQVIYLGRYDKLKTYERLERLKIFYRQGLPYAGWRQYRSFDLRYADQVVCQKRR